ncbi:hypothetical protein CC1G_03429 [Coprinopsis cinerea okayama7|uniref:Uncharacterized protein n=1 Tax=Coprinopsis cinerea (strain Okayama-7 / 130 / ATCC MYA-4618 / FGSC 9003) TaxID=240176 RepID=A8NQP7_COPC7|nr:hypothetical protein CC1G_03429 [Coprinopsis cinerea okayama7\|eukprot:XP_001835647.1 hypothetical protein CC1G_03429 [Coprinopsis cinerea okayama7\
MKSHSGRTQYDLVPALVAIFTTRILQFHQELVFYLPVLDMVVASSNKDRIGHSSSMMKQNEIYAALTEVNVAGMFHWSLYVVEADGKPGWQVHATNKDTDVWRFAQDSWDGPSSEGAIAFLKIGEIMEGLDVSCLLEYVQNIPMAVPPSQEDKEPAFTCRVWFKEAVRILNDSGLFVECMDVDALEYELAQRAIVAQYSRQLPVIAVAKNARAWT